MVEAGISSLVFMTVTVVWAYWVDYLRVSAVSAKDVASRAAGRTEFSMAMTTRQLSFRQLQAAWGVALAFAAVCIVFGGFTKKPYAGGFGWRHGVLAGTMVVLTSDNGFHHGQNRRNSKFVPYTPALQVPLWLRGPGVTARGTDASRMVSGVDVAATIYDATGATPSSVLDGQSLLDPSARTEVYAEYFNDSANGAGIPSWATVRSGRWQYIETYDATPGTRPFREWYDLAADPHMLRNLLADGDPANDPPTGAVAARLAAYRTCAGAGCPRWARGCGTSATAR